MKAIKLLITFVVLLALVVLAFVIVPKSTVSHDLPDPPDETLKEVRTQIEQDWEQANDWDETVFEKHCDKLNQMKCDYSVGTLVDLNTRLAVETVYKKLMDGEWKSESCREKVVDKYINALGVIIKADANAKDNNNVKKLYQVNGVYKKALSVSRIRIGLSPGFDGSSWNSFSKYSKNIKDRRDSINSNTIYKEHLSNIREIKNGLANIDSRLSEARKDFYISLANAITSYYSRIPSSERNNSQLRTLRNVRDRYNSEYHENKNLNGFVKAFYDDITNNEKKQKINRI